MEDFVEQDAVALSRIAQQSDIKDDQTLTKKASGMDFDSRFMSGNKAIAVDSKRGTKFNLNRLTGK